MYIIRLSPFFVNPPPKKIKNPESAAKGQKKPFPEKRGKAEPAENIGRRFLLRQQFQHSVDGFGGVFGIGRGADPLGPALRHRRAADHRFILFADAAVL